jgi:Transposase DDE domain
VLGGHGKRLIDEIDLEPRGGQTMTKREHKTKLSAVESLVSQWAEARIARLPLGPTVDDEPERDCVACPLKSQCCPNTPVRKVVRSIHERASDLARHIATTPGYQRSGYERRKVEMLFAHLKSILNLGRLRLHGLNGANDEFTLPAAVQNLRRMAKLIAQGPPSHGIGAPA